MRRRALIGALSIVFLAPVFSAWCVQCAAGDCPMPTMTQPRVPAVAEPSCHAAPSASGFAMTTAESDCCRMALIPAAASALTEAVHFGHHPDPLPGEEAPLTIRPTLSPTDTAPRPVLPGASPPLFTLHRSLLL